MNINTEHIAGAAGVGGFVVFTVGAALFGLNVSPAISCTIGGVGLLTTAVALKVLLSSRKSGRSSDADDLDADRLKHVTDRGQTHKVCRGPNGQSWAIRTY